MLSYTSVDTSCLYAVMLARCYLIISVHTSLCMMWCSLDAILHTSVDTSCLYAVMLARCYLIIPVYTRGRTYAKKLRFLRKKRRLRKSENAVRLLYAKNSDLTHQNAFSLFVFCTHQRRFVEHLPWV